MGSRAGRIALVLVGALLAFSAQAQITFRSSATATSGGLVFVAAGAINTDTGACNQVITPAIPAGNVDDLLVAVVLARDGGTFAPSAGWTTLFTDNQANHRTRIYYRIADGSGTDTLTVTKTAACTDTLLGAVARFRGADTTTPFMGGGTTVSQFQNSANIGSAAGTINATVQNAMALFAVTVSDDNTVNVPAGFNSAFALTTTAGGDGAVSLFYKNETGTGNKGPYTTTQSAVDNNHGVLALIRPDPGSLTISMPTGTVDGDVMVAGIAVRPCSVTNGGACATTVTAPAGWTLIGAQDQTGGGINASFGSRLLTYYRVASGDTGPYTWTIGGNPAHAGAAGGISSYQKVDNANPIVASASSATASAAAHLAPSVNSGTVTHTRLVTFHSVNSSGALTQPTGMTERYEVDSLPANNVSGLSLSQNDQAIAAAGATGTRSSTFSGPATDTGATYSILLRASDTNFEVVNGSFTVNCTVSPMVVTVIARKPDGSVDTGYTGSINITTSTANGNWALLAGSGTFNNGAANDGAATYTFDANDRGIASFNLTNTTATTLTVTVADASTTLSAASATTITFVADGYRLIPDTVQVAGRNQVWSVQHLVSPACTPSTASGHGASNNVKIWLTLDGSHPGAATLPGTAGTGVTVVSPLPTAEPGANNVALPFAAGTAAFQLTTSDVGKFVLNIRDTNTTIRGTSAPITVRPFALAFPGILHGSSDTSTVNYIAGDNFSATVTAYNWNVADDANNDGVPDAGVNVTNNTATPRFGWDVTVAPTANLAGIAGAISRGASCDTAGLVAQASFAAGTATATDWCYSEVGNVFLTATATNYLNSPGVTVTGSSGLDGTGTGANGYVGRFKPKRFVLTGTPTLTNRAAAACGTPPAYSYMNEGLTLAFGLTAQNTQGATTVNYNGLYARLGLTTFGNYGLGARSGTTNLTARIDTGVAPTGTWTNGVASVSITTGIRRNSPDAPDGPFTGIGFGIAPSDPDTVPMSTLDFDADNNTIFERKSLGVSTEARFGRLRLTGAGGSEKFALALPIEAQQWNGSNFVTNTDDSCTVLDRSNIALAFSGSVLVACETAVTTAAVPFTAGVGSLKLAASGAGNTGSVIVTPQLSGASGSYCTGVGGSFSAAVSANRSYLLGRWDDAANPDANVNTNYDDNPSVRAAFGVFGARPNNVIFHRENY